MDNTWTTWKETTEKLDPYLKWLKRKQNICRCLVNQKREKERERERERIFENDEQAKTAPTFRMKATNWNNYIH